VLVLRLLGAAFAVVMCAWFALGAHQAREVDHASAIIARSSTLSHGAADEALSALASARKLNPDRTVDILRGAAVLERGDRRQARRILETVTRSEPRNLEAWVWLARASGGDPTTYYEALIALHTLAPPLRQR